jgi:hypothetical protein
VTAPSDWSVSINLSSLDVAARVALTADHNTILNLLRMSYPMFENHFRLISAMPAGKRPATLVDDVLVLLRCLVLNRLEAYPGKFVTITPA